MSEPLIACLCLAHTRRDFLERSIRCFEAQSYGHKIWCPIDTRFSTETIGSLRNQAIQSLRQQPDFIAQWDYDDLSAPDRLSIQLAHIQKTGKLVTGFHSMPMYDAKNDKVWMYRHHDERYALGTSLFYRRETWERVKFPDKTPEDNQWRREVGLDNCLSQSSLREDGTPIMIQTVHGGNASARIVPSNHTKFTEASPELDAEVRRILKTA